MAWNAIFLPCNFIPRMNFACTLYNVAKNIFRHILISFSNYTYQSKRNIGMIRYGTGKKIILKIPPL